MTTRRFGTILRHLRESPEAAQELAAKLPDEALIELGAAIRDEQSRRAREAGDQEAVLEAAFRTGFGRDGLGVQPWIEKPFLVCPGGLVGKNRGNHKCQFVSVDDVWVWDSGDLIHEEKRNAPGDDEGFRAVALLPIVEGMALDVVRARMRQGQHNVERVVSYVVEKGKLVEVERRDVSPRGAR
ncbi:MAG: hypothetical protein R3F29_05825 [Planctomycetota bacterium]